MEGYGAIVVEGRQLKGIAISNATSCDDVEPDRSVVGETDDGVGGDNGI